MTSSVETLPSNNNVTNYTFLFFMSLVLSLLVRSFFKLFLHSPNFNVNEPPSPPSLPIIGHLHLVGSKFPQSFKTLARKYGPLMKLRIGSSTFLVAASASFAKEILRTHEANFDSRFEIGPQQYNIYRGTGFIIGPCDNYWKFMKKLCMNKIFAVSVLNRFNHAREQEILKLIRRLKDYSTEGKQCNLSEELEVLSNSLMCKMLMSKRFASENSNGGNSDFEAREMRKLVVEIMRIGAKLSASEIFGVLKKFDFFGNGKKLINALRRFDSVMEQIMKDYEENKFVTKDKNGDQEKDVMAILLEACGEINSEVKITRKHIKHFILELFMASVDTLSASMQWSMAELINHPNVFKNLRAEIESVVGPTRMVKESDVPDLPYLQAIIKESLRLHPPAPILCRECTNDCNINGFDVKEKIKVFINAYAVMRDPNTWHDPDKYDPERFLVSDGASLFQGQDFTYIPFGGGRRGCLGATHANLVMHATIGALVQCFNWTVEGKIEEIDVGSGFSGALPPPLLCYPTTHYLPF